MAGTQWPQEQILLFLETLQSEAVIWDPNDRGHKDKKKINDAWMRIQEILQISVDELKKKDSLIATYRGYHRKREASIKSGAGVDDIYRPTWFAFEYMNSFLGRVYRCKKTMNTDQNDETEPDVQEENGSYSSVPITSPPPMEIQNSTSDLLQAPKKTIRRRNNPPELQIAGNQMSEAFNNLNKIINKTTKSEEDECDLFGKIIAKKLRKLPDFEREDLMFEIHGLFLKSRFDRGTSFDLSHSSTPDSAKQPTYYNLKRPRSENSTILSSTTMSSLSEPPITNVDESNKEVPQRNNIHGDRTPMMRLMPNM